MDKTQITLRSAGFLSDTFSTTVLATLGKGAGFAVPILIAYWFGVTEDTDAFFYVYGLILLLAGVFAGAVQSVIVPFIAEIKTKDDLEIKKFLGGALVISTVVPAAVGVLFILASRPILSVVSDFSSESLDLIFVLLLETLPLLILLVATSFMSGVLNAYKKFALPAISPGLRAIIALVIIFLLKDRIGVHCVALGYVCGELVRFVVLLAHALAAGITPSLRSLALGDRLLQFLKTASYQVIGMIALAFSPVVDKTMASWIAPGSVSVLEYANRLYEVPITLIQSGFFVVLLSHWSGRFYEGLGPRFKQEVAKTAGLVGAGALAMSIALILFRAPLVSLVYGHGEFPPERLSSVSAVWALFLIGLGPMLFGRVFGRAHLVLKNTKLLMATGMASVLLKIALNLLLVRPLGLPGIALATTITASTLAVVLMICLFRMSIGAGAAGQDIGGEIQTP